MVGRTATAMASMSLSSRSPMSSSTRSLSTRAYSHRHSIKMFFAAEHPEFRFGERCYVVYILEISDHCTGIAQASDFFSVDCLLSGPFLSGPL
ncbi:hypothetical protein GUJ93_ZPchr0008g12623 [Zizania palustris]|uniref:Uncharacterized protein n=1 Tax=Zizania palustris TaxID=103762 RepID=A0A8J5RUA2_ZIZPA|nr:hypothetical protein GUJ93_ZPchr0008g12623 [Zizania palustris]